MTEERSKLVSLYEYSQMLRNYFEVHSWGRQQTKYDSDFIADIYHKLSALCNQVYELTQAGYVQLAEDQGLPVTPGYFAHDISFSLSVFDTYGMTQQDMVKDNWKRIRRE